MPYFYFNPWGENIFNVLRVETRESEKLSVKICNYSLMFVFNCRFQPFPSNFGITYYNHIILNRKPYCITLYMSLIMLNLVVRDPRKGDLCFKFLFFL